MVSKSRPRALGEELGGVRRPAGIGIDLELLKSFPQKLIYRHSLFPLSRVNGSLTLATANPLDVYALDEASAVTGLTIIPVVAEKAEIAKLTKKHLGVGSETVEGLIAAREEEGEVELLEGLEVDGSELSEMAQEASVVRLVNEILVEAIDSRASDVHVESQAAGLVVLTGSTVFYEQPVPPEISRFQLAIISRLKIMARLNIAEIASGRPHQAQGPRSEIDIGYRSSR